MVHMVNINQTSHYCLIRFVLLGGHGTHGLYKADVPLLSNEVCSYLMDRQIPGTEVCAGRKHGGVDSCQVNKRYSIKG